MPDQKVENALNLARNISAKELEKTTDLQIGYDKNERKWELIIRYEGSLAKVRQLSDSVTELLGGYAVITIAEDLINVVSDLQEVIYVEKPKRLNFQIENGIRNSCINPVKSPPYNLSGEGVLIGIVDSGIDFTHRAFIDGLGESRILEIWDQELDRVYTKEEIDMALSTGELATVGGRDISGHGTAVASIAATVATSSQIVAVKLGNPKENSFPRTSELMRGIDYLVRKAMDYGRPMAINVSIGNNYGSHDGTSLLSTYIDTVASMSRLSISVGTGNEGFSATHTSGILSNTQDRERAQTVEFNVGAYERSFNIQLWKSYVDSFNIVLKSPSGASTGVVSNVAGIGEYLLENTRIYVYYGEPSPYSQYQEIYLEFIPVDNYIQAGTWQIDLSPVRIVDGRYDMWLPVESTSKDTAFLEPTPDTTLTVPSTSSAVVSVGAYDAYTDGYADFSGRGYTRVIGQVKPDIVAPGVNIVAAEANYSLDNNNYVERTGTSFATPFATGSAALMMEWGIVKGNDMYMYGEKIKAYLQKGARQLAGFKEYPNPQVGYGALCLRDSIAGS